MTTAWANLPNARHIDAVLAHAKAHPGLWRDTRGAAWDAAWATARNAAWDAAQHAAWDAARYATWAAARAADRADARDACYALIVWDDAGQLMDMPVDAVRTLAASRHHPAILLLPARLAMDETP